jgi:hypothetical protein
MQCAPAQMFANCTNFRVHGAGSGRHAYPHAIVCRYLHTWIPMRHTNVHVHRYLHTNKVMCMSTCPASFLFSVVRGMTHANHLHARECATWLWTNT